jgi:vacuolar protein sorting-associated protein 8
MSSFSLASATARELEEDGASTIRQPSLNIPDNDGEDESHQGDYSSRLEELLGDGSDIQDDESDGEDFLYTGVDTDVVSGGYREQLRDVLGEHGDDDAYENEVENSLLHHDESSGVHMSVSIW